MPSLMAVESPLECPGPERRAACRYPCRVRVYYQPGLGNLDGFWWRGVVCDISTDGVGLLLGQRFEPDTLLTLELPALPHNPSRSLQAQVVRVTTAPEGRWLTGCALVSPLRAEELFSERLGLSQPA
jgi:hypothetical protein